MTFHQLISISIVALAGLGLAACDEGPSPRELSQEVRVDRTQVPRGTSSNPCDEIEGMFVCTDEYAEQEAECRAWLCEQYGADAATVEQCWQQGYDFAQSNCEHVEDEWELCKSGVLDPDTCYPGPDSAGGGTPGGGTDEGPPQETCVDCSCTNSTGTYESIACGETTTEIVADCYGSC